MFPRATAVELLIDMYGAGGNGGSGSSFSCPYFEGSYCAGGGSGGAGAFAQVALVVNLVHSENGFPRFLWSLGLESTSFAVAPHEGFELDGTTKVFGSPITLAAAHAGGDGARGYGRRVNNQCGACIYDNSCAAGGSAGTVSTASWSPPSADALHFSVTSSQRGDEGTRFSKLMTQGPTGTRGIAFGSGGRGSYCGESVSPPGAGALFVDISRVFYPGSQRP